jgi:hypothetical protein
MIRREKGKARRVDLRCIAMVVTGLKPLGVYMGSLPLMYEIGNYVNNYPLSAKYDGGRSFIFQLVKLPHLSYLSTFKQFYFSFVCTDTGTPPLYEISWIKRFNY